MTLQKPGSRKNINFSIDLCFARLASVLVLVAGEENWFGNLWDKVCA